MGTHKKLGEYEYLTTRAQHMNPGGNNHFTERLLPTTQTFTFPKLNSLCLGSLLLVPRYLCRDLGVTLGSHQHTSVKPFMTCCVRFYFRGAFSSLLVCSGRGIPRETNVVRRAPQNTKTGYEAGRKRAHDYVHSRGMAKTNTTTHQRSK